MPSAEPRDNFTPWGTTGHTSARAQASRRVLALTKQVSATTSTRSRRSGAARASAAMSGRHPMPTAVGTRERQARPARRVMMGERRLLARPLRRQGRNAVVWAHNGRVETSTPTQSRSFAALNLSAETLSSLEQMGYQAPTDVQFEA